MDVAVPQIPSIGQGFLQSEFLLARVTLWVEFWRASSVDSCVASFCPEKNRQRNSTRKVTQASQYNFAIKSHSLLQDRENQHVNIGEREECDGN